MEFERKDNLERFLKTAESEVNLICLSKDTDCSAFTNQLNEALDKQGPDCLIAFAFQNPFGVHEFSNGLADTLIQGQKRSGWLSFANVSNVLREKQIEGRWFYPYPNLELATTFFSDLHLPSQGECDDNCYNFDKPVLASFDEKQTTSRLVEAGMFAYLSNAYLLVIGEKANELPSYTRFSMERGKQYQIRTDLYPKQVVKKALWEQGKEHIQKMARLEQGLSEFCSKMRILDKEVAVNRLLDCKEDTISFAFEKGESLEGILDRMLEQRQTEKASDILLSVCKQFEKLADGNSFETTDQFKEIFGYEEDWEDCLKETTSLPLTDIDFVCQNILVDEKITLIDYEWSFDFPIPVFYMVYRFLYFYLEAKNREGAGLLELKALYEKAGLNKKQIQISMQMETHFQQYVQADAYILRNQMDLYGKPVLGRQVLDALLDKMSDMQLTMSAGDEQVSIGLKQGADGVYSALIHPQDLSCSFSLEGLAGGAVLRIGYMAKAGNEEIKTQCSADAFVLSAPVYRFDKVPKFSLTFEKMPETLLLSIEQISMTENAAAELQREIEDLRFLLDNREQQLLQMRESLSWKITKPIRSIRK